MYIKASDYWMFDGIKSLKGINRSQLKKAIETVSSEIDEYCNTRFEPTEDSYTLDLKEKFCTRRQPLLEVTELNLCGRTLAADEDYFVYPESSRVETNGLESRQYKKALEVKYLFGYQTVPATVKQVIVDLIKLDMESKSLPYQGLQSESWDNEYSYARHPSKDFTPAELRKNILARLDDFKVEPYVEARNSRIVEARLL